MIKITIRKDDPDKTAIKWWVEGFEEKEISEKDIIEVRDIMENCKNDILNTMYERKSLESKTRESKLELIQFKE
jgi:hypothetical protein